MDFTTSVKTCFGKYATFRGRASRSEFWWFMLFTALASSALGLLDAAMFGAAFQGSGPLGGLFSLATLLPSVSVAVRRLHDTERSGWFWWLVLVPVIGWIILIVWYASKGTNGGNRFGTDPLGGSGTGHDGGSQYANSPDRGYARSRIPKVPRN